MVRQIRTISPRKEVRRSIREKTTVYRSLAENHLGTALSDIIGHQTDYPLRKHHNSYTRSGRKIESYHEAPSDDDDFESSPYIRRAKRIARQDHEDENSPIINRQKRRKLIIEDESEPGSRANDESGDANTSYSHNKQTHETKSPNNKRSKHIRFINEDSSPNQRETRYQKKETGKKATDNVQNGFENDEHLEVENGGDSILEGDGEEDTTQDQKETNSEDEQTSLNDDNDAVDDDEEEPMPRQYQLRNRRETPSHSRKARQVRNSTRISNMARPDYKHSTQYCSPGINASRRSEFKRRMCRSDSSSTGSEDEKEMRRQTRRDDTHFEKRKERSMMKARNRFTPINLSAKDLMSSHNVVRERMRQTGASCSDVDPMAIDKTVGFKEIGGLGPHIQSLKEVVLFPLLYPDIFHTFNINPPRGVLFYGPPGTGKTLVARALANECSRGDKKVAFFMRKGADCLSKWVGESERQLRILFDQAYSMRPSIIFFDEIDGLAPVRSTRQDQIHSSIVSTLLALMDGLDNRGEVIVIGATNRLDSIDPALRRPGRFDRELRFSLPDSAARLQILNIHTSKWADNKPEEDLLKWLAEHTSGYCGADLKYLCTETVMISLRNSYPHIYMSHERLQLDLSNIRITKDHLLAAMKRITPASRRDLSIPCRALDERTSILLAEGLVNLLKSIPESYKCSTSVEVTGSCELEKVVRALEEQPPISSFRSILVSHPTCSDSGQTSYFLPALLSKLDHLPVHCISISKLFADGRPEEAFATIFQAALRSAASGPCILLCPSIDEWFKIVPPSVTHMLKVALDQLTGFTPIFFLATAECCYNLCPEEVMKIFRIHTSTQIPLVPLNLRKRYFKYICSQAFVPPNIFDPTKYVQPAVAKCEDKPIRHLNEKEAKELEKLYENQLREFRIFLRDQLGKLTRDRRFLSFVEPVDIEEAEDYYEIIKEPICFTQMQEKVDRREYNHPDQFLADIKLIVNNALEYNPIGDLHSKAIRHSAISLRDIVEEYFEKEFDEDFVEELERTARLLAEAKIVPQNEQLLHLPDGFVRKTRWSVVNGFKGSAYSTKTSPKSLPGKRLKMFRGSSYKLKSDKRKQKSRAIVQSIAQSLTQAPETPEEKPSNHEGSLQTSAVHEEETRKSMEVGELNIIKNVTIDQRAMDDVIDAAIKKTDQWPIPELETFAAAMCNIIEKYRNLYDREKLPFSLLTLIDEWEYTPSFNHADGLS